MGEMGARIAFVCEQLNDPDAGWLLGDSLLFFEVTPALLSIELLEGLAPAGTVLILDAAELGHPDTLAAIKSLRDEGFGICLRGVDFDRLDKALIELVTHVEVRYGSPDFSLHARIHGASGQAPIRIIARQVGTWDEYDSCAALGVDTFVGKLYLTPRSERQAKGLNPAQVMILQLMEMVRKNADVRQLEGILRRDAAISYKLLRYINSVGFGLGAEIQSLRHAVTMLGYSPLYRWLSLLLATASTAGHSPVLMQTAVIRGRFAELLGQGFLPKNEAENLFVAGMFSLLDRLLGIPMEQVLENLQLSEPVEQALLSRSGMYGPFLALAEACESNNGNAGELADSLFISPQQVNEAHLSALSWAQNLKL
jgi:EAL and modified HD-GYP domain-containing signal transduction protein